MSILKNHLLTFPQISQKNGRQNNRETPQHQFSIARIAVKAPEVATALFAAHYHTIKQED